MTVDDIATAVPIADWAIVKAPRINAIRFSTDGRDVIANVDEGDDIIFLVARPRRGIDYKAAYAGVEFTENGIEFPESFPVVREARLPLPANFSTILLAQKLSEQSLQEAIEWHYARLQISVSNDR